MDRIKIILRYQWTAYWRRFSRKGSGNFGIFLLLAFFALPKYFQLLQQTAVELANGESSKLGLLLGGIFLAWLFPLMGDAQFSISTDALRHFPLSQADLFKIKLASLLMPPSSWIIAACSLAICYPISLITNPAIGIAAALLFSAMSFFAGISIVNLIGGLFWRSLFFSLFLITLFGLYLLVFGNGTAELSLFLSKSLVASAVAVLWQKPLAMLAGIGAAAISSFFLAAWSFKAGAVSSPIRHSQKGAFFRSIEFQNRLGAFLTKDFRYFRRLLDPYLGLLVGLLYVFYLVFNDSASPVSFGIVLIIIFIMSSSVAFNCFGLDNRSGLIRYAIFPVTGKEIIQSKNIAFAVVVAAQISLIIPFVIWKLGVAAVAFGIVEIVLLALGYITWGNSLSVNQPYQMQPLRFSSGGSLVEAFGGVIFGSLPGLAALWLFRENNFKILLITPLLLILYGIMYLYSVGRAGRNFEHKQESIALW